MCFAEVDVAEGQLTLFYRLGGRAERNRRLEEELAEALRYGTELSLIMCDIDHFKRVNDTYGHPVGDRILRGLATLLGEGRGSDVPCRYGGEEFMIILPHTAMEEAYAFAERLREAIRRVRWKGHGDLVITASFGVADLTCVDEPTVQAVVTAVDRAMYAAKQAGRDQVQTAQSSDPRLRQSA